MEESAPHKEGSLMETQTPPSTPLLNNSTSPLVNPLSDSGQKLLSVSASFSNKENGKTKKRRSIRKKEGETTGGSMKRSRSIDELQGFQPDELADRKMCDSEPMPTEPHVHPPMVESSSTGKLTTPEPEKEKLSHKVARKWREKKQQWGWDLNKEKEKKEKKKVLTN